MENKIFYDREGECGKYIMQDLSLPATHTDPAAVARYAKYGKRIHWIDSNNMPGCFQMNTSWYFAPNKPQDSDGASSDGSNSVNNAAKSHVHDFDEIVGFYGSNPDDPYDLGGEIEMYLNGECHRLTKSTLIYIPAGMYHAPLYITKVDRPIFHFSVVMSTEYSTRDSENGELNVAK